MRRATVLTASACLIVVSALRALVPPGFAIRCVDPEGAPVAGAEVHAFQRVGLPDGTGQYARFGPFLTDADGRARCEVALTYGGGLFDRFVYARVPDRLVGGARSARFEPAAAGDSPPDIEARMVPSRTLAGSVRVPPGRDRAGVRVSVLSGYIAEPNGPGAALARLHGVPGLDDALPERFECQADEGGAFELRDVPRSGRLYLAASGPGLAQGQWSNVRRRLPDLVELELAEESVLVGRIQRRDGTGFAGARVTARLVPTDTVGVMTSFRATSDPTGAFRIGGLPAGDVDVLLELRDADLVGAPRRVRVGSPDTAVVIVLETGVHVGGTVVAAGDDGPIAGVGVDAVTADGVALPLCHARTDDQGRFRMSLPAVPARLYFSSIPRGFARPDQQTIAVLDVATRDMALRRLRFTLARGE